MIFESKDLLINFGQTPDNNSQEFDAFWAKERQKCKEGIMIDGVFINPFLYWHCNLWTIISDHITKGRIRQKPDFRDSEWILTNRIWEAETWKNEDGLIRKKGVVAAGCRRFSKALEHGSIVYTENGEKDIKDVKIGDKIFDETGNLTSVINVLPQGRKDIYEISLLDNRKLYCSEDHLWTLLTKKTTKKERKGDKLVTLSTIELLGKYKNKRKNSHKKGEYTYEYKYSIPNNLPVKYKSSDLLLDPYFIGLWLGDGCSRTSAITNIDKEVIDYVYDFARINKLNIRKDGQTYHVTSNIKGGDKFKTRNSVLKKLQSLKLIKNKHIPKNYLYSSIEQRMELLKGLMDTDGTISKNGDISFTTTSEQLASDFYFLCRSLGINLKKSEREGFYKKDGNRVKCKKAYYFQIYTNLNLFKIKRKSDRVKVTKGDWAKINKTKIVNIEKVRVNDCTCITVDNYSGLFLTNNFTITHNSVLEASFCAWKACNWKNSQVVVSGGNEPDIKIITDMIDLGINELPNYYMKSKVEDNWKKQVALGYKDAKTNQRNIWSTFAIRNFDGGNNEEALAGLTPDGGIIDEAGKYSFLKALLAGLPGLTTPNGWRGSFLVMGTGGDMDNFQDFQKLFDEPDTYNFLSCDLPEENRKCGVFLPGWMSYAYPKEPTDLCSHLNLDAETHPNLSKVEIKVADKEKNEALIDAERKAAGKSNDVSALLKHTMYFPKTTREIFLSATHNNFPIEACKMHQQWLRENSSPDYIEFFRDSNNKLDWRFSSLLPITDFPINSSHFKEAPVVIYEHPEDNAPNGVYCIGIDCYNKNESSDRVNSLGTIYVFKRMSDPLGASQHALVASYAGRPDDISKFYNIAYNLCEYYNGIILPELNERFSDFFVNKKKGYVIQNAMQLARDINQNSFAKGSEKGLSPTTRNQRYGMELLVSYTIEEIVETNGDIKMGVVRIPDPMLLEEMINYRAKPKASNGIHDGNFDRIVACYHALILAEHLDKYMPIAHQKSIDKKAEKPKEIVLKGFFGNLVPKKKSELHKPSGFRFI